MTSRAMSDTEIDIDIETRLPGEGYEPVRPVRTAVFIDEQGVDPEIEYDGKDDQAIHVIAWDGEQPVGTARLRALNAETVKVERVAVLSAYRGQGIGRRVMTELEAVARDRGYTEVRLHAQTAVEGFYHNLGYRTVSEPFDEAGIEHVEMERSLVD